MVNSRDVTGIIANPQTHMFRLSEAVQWVCLLDTAKQSQVLTL